MLDISQLTVRALALPSVVLATGYILVQLLAVARRRARGTPVRGPPRSSLLFGCWAETNELHDCNGTYQKWTDEYGVVVDVPMPLGIKRFVLMDPKAIASFFAKDTCEYVMSKASKLAIESLVRAPMLQVKCFTDLREQTGRVSSAANSCLMGCVLNPGLELAVV